MWLLKVPLFLFLIGATKSKKDSQLALEEYYQEASQIYEKANKIHLENELATGKIGGLDVAERILNKKMDASVLEEYVEMKISGGLEEQNEMLELFEKAEEVETSDQLKDDIENGFTLMDGFSDLKNELSKFILDFENDLKGLEERLNSNYVFVEDELTDRFDQLFYDNSKFAEKIEPLSHLSEDQALSDDEKKLLSRAIYNLERLIGRQDILDILKLQDLNNDLHNLDSFKQTQVVIEKLNSMMNEVKNLEGLASELPKIEKEIEILEELRDGNEIQEISNRSQNLTKSSDFLKDFRISTNVHGQYESIQSISPLLQKIKSFLSKMKTFLYRTSRSSKKLSTLEKHFESTKIPSGNLAKKFSRLRECINTVKTLM